MYLAAMLPVILHSWERGHVAALLTLANAPITGLVSTVGVGGVGAVNPRESYGYRVQSVAERSIVHKFLKRLRRHGPSLKEY